MCKSHPFQEVVCNGNWDMKRWSSQRPFKNSKFSGSCFFFLTSDCRLTELCRVEEEAHKTKARVVQMFQEKLIRMFTFEHSNEFTPLLGVQIGVHKGVQIGVQIGGPGFVGTRYRQRWSIKTNYWTLRLTQVYQILLFAMKSTN